MAEQLFCKLVNNIVVDRRVVQRDFLEANPERYSGVWVETFLGVEGKTCGALGMVYDPITQDFHCADPDCDCLPLVPEP